MMLGNTSRVKQLLSTARIYRRPGLLHEVVSEVRDAELSSGRPSAELRVLCAEVAVELKQWSIAAEVLKGVGTAQETRLLAVRFTFCEVLVALHHIDESTFMTHEEKVQVYVRGAASALQALAEAVELWPDSLDAVLRGIHTLWHIASFLFTAGREADVCEAVSFLATLHQQLHIGGGYTLVQWLVRAALCLRAAERYNEAATRFSAALESAALMGNQRLFVQVLRLAAGVIFVKEKGNASCKTRVELLPGYRNRPVHFAVLLTYLLLGGLVEVEACKEDLQSAYCGLSEVIDAAPQPPESGAPASRGKKKQAAVKAAPAARLADAFAVTDPDVIDEVKSDMLFCISLHGTLSPEQVEELERKRSSLNCRVRSFATYAHVVRESHRNGLSSLGKCADASSISTSHRAEVRALASELVNVLKNTNAIHDESERQHTLRIGASLLWNLVLPFFQSGTIGDVQAALTAVADVSQAFVSSLKKLFFQAVTLQCQTAFEDDNRSVLHHLLPMLQRECDYGQVEGEVPACLFRLHWLQRQMAIQDELESSLTSPQDRCLFALEQARCISNPLKRIPVIKTAFRHLPPVVQESDVQPTSAEATEPQKAAPVRGVFTTCRSTIQLYRELLELCMQDLSASLYAVAMAVAEALRGLPCPVSAAENTEIEEVRAAASLHAATILARQLEEAEPHRSQKDARSAEIAEPRIAATEDSEGCLAALLLEAAQRGTELECRRSGSGSWIAANACVAFLNWKRPAYARGEYRAHLHELLDLQKLYIVLFEHDQVQDVELLSALTTSSVIGLVAEYLETTKPPPGLEGLPLGKQVSRDGFEALVQRLRACAYCEPSNAQLRHAHVMCLEALHIIPVMKQKWFLAMLSPVLARLVGDKPTFASHPQEHLLGLLGILAGPSEISEKTTLLINDARPLLHKDPCVRLCAWVAAIAMQLRQEDVVLECCEVADRLYACNQLGWGSMFEAQQPSSPSSAASAVASKATDSSSHKKAPGEPVPLQLDLTPTFPKPDAEDWEAYAELLSLKAQIGAEHLSGLNGNARNRAVQLLLTNCVNSAIAAVQGAPASKVERITNAYGLYYTFLRTTRISLETATFVLPSLRMLLSKALLAQLPKRSWSDSFTTVVYQLSCVLVYVSFSSGQEDDANQLVAVLRPLRELLPPRYQKSLKEREVAEMCYRTSSVDDFLQRSKNVEAELQARGWMMLSEASGNASGEAETFALALAASKGNPLATAQCLFEHAYATTLRRGDSTPLAQVTRHLQEALRALEGLPEAVPLLQSGEETQRWNATLAAASRTATFLHSQTQRRLALDSDLAGEAVVAPDAERCAAVLKASMKSRATRTTGVTFHHAFVGLRIVSLLFRTMGTREVFDDGSASAQVAQHTTVPASRRDCVNVMLDYISCLWHLSARWLCEDTADEDAVILQLPAANSLYYGYAEPSAAAQRLRGCVPDEEFKLNTEGLWQCLLDLGDYLARTGDEPHAFMVYSWVRFAAALTFGDARGDSRCALVQRLCNWKMCAAAASSGLSDSPYVAALTLLTDTRFLVEEAVKRDVEGKRVSPSWEAAMVVGECEIRVHLGQTEEAATLAEDVLCRGLECASWNAPVIRARALRVRARYAAICSRYGDALRTLQQAFELIGVSTLSTAATVISVRLWAELCSDQLTLLIDAQSTAEAVQWAGTVRQQLHQWRVTSAAGATQADTPHAACVRAEVEDVLEFWASHIITIVEQQPPLADVIGCQVAYSSQAHRRIPTEELLREVLLLAEGSTTLHSRLYTTHAQWHLRDRVTPQWLTQHSTNVNDVRARLLVLLAEIQVLDELSLHLQNMPTSRDVEVDSARQSEVRNVLVTGMSFWRGTLFYWTAIDRLEASELVSCLLVAFQHLSMEELGLPTSNAPAHCEREVLRFIRGAASSPSLAATAEGVPKTVVQAVKVGARWSSDVAHKAGVLQQALQYYNVTDPSAQAMLEVSAVPALLEKAAIYCRQWPHTRLAAAILVAVAQVEMLQRVENQLEQVDDLLIEEQQARAQALLTAAWSRARLLPARIDKPGIRTHKSTGAGKKGSLNEPSPTAVVPPLTEEEEALVQRISLGIQVAVHHGHFDMAAQLSDKLGDLAVLLDHPRIAAAAAECTQANQLVGLLWRRCVHEMKDSAEGRLWRQMRAVQPLFTNCTSYTQLAHQVMAATPMERALRSCSLLCVEPEKKLAEVPSTPPTKGSHITEVSPYAIDSAVLSVAVGNCWTGFCIVTLRHPSGAVEGRRRYVPQQTWAALTDALQKAEARKQEQLGSTDDMRVSSAEERVTAEDLSDVLKELNAVAGELFGEFQASLQQYCEKTPLYLCLAPELQSFPWEQTCVLSCCPVVLRELGAAVVVSRIREFQRYGKRALQHTQKPGGSSSTKGSSSGSLVCLIDVFGDHPESVAATCGTDHTKSKVSPQCLVTCSSAGVPPDAEYLTWMLQNAAPGALVVNMCGNLTDALPWSDLASLNFTQLNGAVLADGASNASSQQREERLRISTLVTGIGKAVSPSPYPRWMTAALFLLRGVKFAAANAFACSPSVTDALARRCLSSVSSGKALVEQLRGKSGDAKTPFVTLYGILGSGSFKSKS